MARSLGLLTTDLATVRPLQDALAARGITPTVLVAGDLRLDLAVRTSEHGVCVNVVGAQAPAAVRALATEYLAYLADIEVPTVNGLDAFVIGASPARALALLDHLGIAHPPARIVAERSRVSGALADLGLRADQVRVGDGPPVVVQAAPDVGPVVRIDYVAGRQLAATAQGRPVTVDLAIGKLGAAVMQTGGIEFGGVSFGLDPASHRPTCVGVDTELPTAARALDALVDHITRRGGLAG